eukprot:6409483-Amphidinium_carterae.1
MRISWTSGKLQRLHPEKQRKSTQATSQSQLDVMLDMLLLSQHVRLRKVAHSTSLSTQRQTSRKEKPWSRQTPESPKIPPNNKKQSKN